MPDEEVLGRFFERLGAAGEGLLLLDYDGTLAPFTDSRFDAVPAPGIREKLNALLQNPKSRTIFVSGRPCDELVSLAALEKPVEIWGCHGREFRNLAGETSIHGVTDEQLAVLAREYDRVVGVVPEEKLELKTGCLAFHWRGVPDETRERILAEVKPRWEQLAADSQLNLLSFDGGLELAIPGRTKADAVNELLARENGRHPVVAFLGDDLTDEDGFRALGDRGLSVLVRNEPRETAAQVRIGMPGGVLDFLTRWMEAVG